MNKAWAVMWATFLASIAVVVNQFKVPPVMQTLLTEFQIDLTLGGWLMSIFAVAGILLSLPAALTLDKVGAKLSGIIGLAFTIFGSLIGTFANSASILLIGRGIEGIGLGIIAVVAPAVIAMWFPPEKRGLPMGIWAAWVPVGSFVILNLATPLSKNFGWQGVWWFGTVFTLIALVVYALVVTNPHITKKDKAGEKHGKPLGKGSFSIMSGLKNPAIWLLAIGFGSFGFANAGFVTWGPSFLADKFNLSPEVANFYISLSPMVAIGSTVLAGWSIDKTKKPKLILVVSAILTWALYSYAFLLGNLTLAIVWMLLLGLLPGFFPTASFTLAPETMPTPLMAGLAMAVINLMFNVGFMLGPPVVGGVIKGAQGNWSAGAIPVGALMLVSIATSIIFSRRTSIN